jgi:hypothetical protein
VLRVADIIAFPTADPRRLSADTAGTLRRGLHRLADAAAALDRSRAGLERQHDVLGAVKGQLDVQALRAQAIAGLAGTIALAIAAGDLPAMVALQAELTGLMASAASPPLTDAAD